MQRVPDGRLGVLVDVVHNSVSSVDCDCFSGYHGEGLTPIRAPLPQKCSLQLRMSAVCGGRRGRLARADCTRCVGGPGLEAAKVAI